MNRLIALAYIALIAFAFVFMWRSARAANPPPVASTQQNPDLFQYQGQSLQGYSFDNANLKRTGVWVWRFVPVQGCNSESIRPAIVAGFAQMSRFGMQIREDDNDLSAHVVRATCGVEMSSGCGGPPVIGCLPCGFPYDNCIYISTDMAAYFDVSQRAIALHELLHATFVWNEQYRLDGTFGASNDVTVMNTGPLSRHDLGPDEDARAWRTMGSPELKTLGYGFNGAWYVYACGFDANATRLSVLVDKHDGLGVRWAGTIRDVPRDVNVNGGDKNGCMGLGVPEGLTIQVGAVYYIKQESPSSWAVSHNETRVP